MPFTKREHFDVYKDDYKKCPLLNTKKKQAGEQGSLLKLLSQNSYGSGEKVFAPNLKKLLKNVEALTLVLSAYMGQGIAEYKNSCDGMRLTKALNAKVLRAVGR